ncbi:ion channel TACAN-like [Littorina saxatilis]|uniref:Transmembrane protein 120 homolog n=1 Tax=Littorina saxatilis TaxID=31220 RepID=A0AAN9AJW6_9CAEN
MADNEFATCLEDWEDLEKEYVQLEEGHKNYTKLLEQMTAAQKKCVADIAHHRYRIRRIMETLKKVGRDLTEEEVQQREELLQKIKDRKDNFREMEESLPHKNGIYLSIILGQVNVSLLDKGDKFKYKQEYEKFKLTVSNIIMLISLFTYFIQSYRWVDALLNFLLVWYYCTLTIRESILIVNGSRIKGWWLTHHFVSTVCAGISLIWPEGETYQKFRTTYILFTFYLTFVYALQYYYQSGCLYRLRCLGQGHTMDITVG